MYDFPCVLNILNGLGYIIKWENPTSMNEHPLEVHELDVPGRYSFILEHKDHHSRNNIKIVNLNESYQISQYILDRTIILSINGEVKISKENLLSKFKSCSPNQ